MFVTRASSDEYVPASTVIDCVTVELDSVVAVNDTRQAKSGTVTVRDADTGRTLLAERFHIPANGKAEVGFIAAIPGQAMWLIDYTIGEAKYTNHYLAGRAPFKLADYKRWYAKLGIQPDK